jgi:DNA-binding NtrC family response regulator
MKRLHHAIHRGARQSRTSNGGNKRQGASDFKAESFLAVLLESDSPVDSMLGALLKKLGGTYWIAVYGKARNEDGTVEFTLRGRSRSGRPIARPERLLEAGEEARLLKSRRVLVHGVNPQPCSGMRTWKAGCPIPNTRGGNTRKTSHAPGAFLIGGPVTRFSPFTARKPAQVARMVTELAPWIGAALALEEREAGRWEQRDLEDPSTEVEVVGSSAELHRDFPEIISASEELRRVLSTLSRIGPSDAAVLIAGESGTGKELIAQAIHRKSNRRHEAFLSENCAACPQSLLESEFFGVERGAYTGATRSKAGIFERVEGGTLFLDEVGEMDLRLQAKLLRVLQEREIRRVGGDDMIPVDFRLISATNRSLEEEVRQKRFRLDLLYRLEVVRVEIPPLRKRVEDIGLLARHFLSLHAARLRRPVPILPKRSLELLCRYPWPGNVRELQNEMFRAVAYARATIQPASLSAKIRRLDDSSMKLSADETAPSLDFQEIEKDILGSILIATVKKSKGNTTQAARMLGMPRANLYRRFRKYGIHVGRDKQERCRSVSSVLARYRFLDDVLGDGG